MFVRDTLGRPCFLEEGVASSLWAKWVPLKLTCPDRFSLSLELVFHTAVGSAVLFGGHSWLCLQGSFMAGLRGARHGSKLESARQANSVAQCPGSSQQWLGFLLEMSMQEVEQVRESQKKVPSTGPVALPCWWICKAVQELPTGHFLQKKHVTMGVER